MVRRFLILSPALLMAACTDIPRGWQEAKRTGPAAGVNGAWLGTWRSEVNGHSGGLRAVVTPVAGNAERRQFRFRASWAKILCAGFTLEGTVKQSGPDTWTVSGGKNLGKLFGGTFTCTGTVRGDAFTAHYEAKMDRGVMEMRRVRRE